MKLDTDKERAITLNIEQERREFDAWSETNNFYRTHVKDKSYTPETQKLALEIWLAAKLTARSAGLSKEPVVTLILGGIDGDELDSNDIECHNSAIDALQQKLVRTSEPIYLPLYTATPAPVSAEPISTLSQQQVFDKFSFLEGVVNESYYKRIAETAIALLAASPAAPLSDAKDAERYRFLRSHGNNLTVAAGSLRRGPLLLDALDSEIDAAIAAAKEAM